MYGEREKLPLIARATCVLEHDMRSSEAWKHTVVIRHAFAALMMMHEHADLGHELIHQCNHLGLFTPLVRVYFGDK
jgi:hypothetical protein